MTVQQFLNKYGTCAVSMLIRELAVRKKNNAAALDVANDLQAMLEHLITHTELMNMSVREAMYHGAHEHNGGSE